MALSATMIQEVRPSGSDANGGGFNPANANFAADLAATSGTGTAPVVSSASYNFVAGDVGAYVFVKSGTNWTPGWYLIASVSAGAATLTATIGSVALYTAGLGALAMNTVAGVATTASPTAGTWGIDYSQQDAARLTYTDMVIGVGTSTYTSALNPVGKNLIGNLINVTSGTGFTVQRVEVVSTATITATCDKSLGTTASTGGNGALGGGLGTPGAAASFKVGNSDVYIKNGTYVFSTGSSNVAGGVIAESNAAATTRFTQWVGYDTTRTQKNTDTNRPVLQIPGAGVTSVTIMAFSGNRIRAHNITVDGNGKASITGIAHSGGGGGVISRCKAMNCTVIGFQNAATVTIQMCEATGCSGTVAIDCIGPVLNSAAYANTTHGFRCQNAILDHCVASGNTGASTDGFSLSGNPSLHLHNCLADGNGRAGFDVTGNVGGLLQDCIASNNSGEGFRTGAVQGGLELRGCAGYNNTGGNFTAANIPFAFSFLALVVDPYTSQATGDFTPNNTVGGGASLRAAGFPSTIPNFLGTSYPDVGAFQHQDSGGIKVPSGMMGGLRG